MTTAQVLFNLSGFAVRAQTTHEGEWWLAVETIEAQAACPGRAGVRCRQPPPGAGKRPCDLTQLRPLGSFRTECSNRPDYRRYTGRGRALPVRTEWANVFL
jgi:hypothetical protein